MGRNRRRVSMMGGRPVLPWQWPVLQSQAVVKVVLGGYGSGKTTIAAYELALNAFRNPWRADYGGNHPESVVIGKTDKVIKDSSMKAVRSVLPPGAILKEWKSVGERAFLLCNGHLIKFRTWTGSIEGLTVCGALFDEAHLLDNDQAFTNYMGRLRDPLAVQKRFIVAGIPEFGWLRQTFGPGASFPQSEVWHASARDNIHLSEDDIRRIESTCDAETVKVYVHGQWGQVLGAVFYAYDPARNVIDEPGCKQTHTDLSVDPGNRSACLFLQEKGNILTKDGRRVAGRRLHVIDEILPENRSMEELMRDAKTRAEAKGWRIKPGLSTVFVDPTTDKDELAAIARVFPGVSVLRKKRADMSRNREYGIRCVNAGFLDADGNCRLTISKSIRPHERGLLAALPSFKRHELSGLPVKDNRMDHVLDSLRYAVAHHLPLKGRFA